LSFAHHLLALLNTLVCSLVLSVFYVVGTLIEDTVTLPITGALYGMALLLACLFQFKSFAKWMTQSVQPLLKHMVFFFIPAVMGVFLFTDMIIQNALALILAVVFSTVVCLALTAVFANSRLRKIKSNGTDE
jgi:holin-like protein